MPSVLYLTRWTQPTGLTACRLVLSCREGLQVIYKWGCEFISIVKKLFRVSLSLFTDGCVWIYMFGVFKSYSFLTLQHLD